MRKFLVTFQWGDPAPNMLTTPCAFHNGITVEAWDQIFKEIGRQHNVNPKKIAVLNTLELES